MYHRYFTCQLSSKNKTGVKSKRNKCCPATLDILVKKVNRNTKRNDPFFLTQDPPLNVVITLRKRHNHPNKDNHEALGYLRVSEETKETYKKYFSDGLAPGEAMRLHEAKLLLMDDGPVQIANASVNPNRRTVYYMHTLWQEENYGTPWSDEPLSKLKERAKSYAKRGKPFFHCNTFLSYIVQLLFNAILYYRN